MHLYRHRVLGLLGLLGLVGLLCTGPTRADVPRYRVLADANLREIEVEACFAHGLPERLVAHDERALALVRSVRVAGQRLPPERLRSALPRQTGARCLEYAVALPGSETRNWRDGTWRTRGALLISPRLLLWYPEHPETTGLEVIFELGPGQSVSAPWSELRRSPGRVAYRTGERPADWDALIALGRFETRAMRIGGATLNVAVLEGEPAVDRDAMRAWVASRARALATVAGRFPVPEVQVLVVPVGRSDEAVPWGQVLRGGGDAVHVFVDQTRPRQEFGKDWVLMHELSHLLHPLISGRDRWLSEGLASYYQNVARARSGALLASAAWNKLHAGFERGIRGTPAGRSLTDVSENMLRNRMFMRVYWSGAAIALLADLELRSLTGGAQSLDSALGDFAACCLPSSRIWTAREITDQLDRVTGTRVFSQLYARYADSDRFPDLGDAYARLGLRAAGDTLGFDPGAPEADIRRSIMQGPGG